MILLDEETALLPKAQAAAQDSAPTSSAHNELIGPELPPPPYYQSIQGRPPDGHLHDDESCTHVRASRRLIRAGIVAVVIWTLFSSVIEGVYYAAKQVRKKVRHTHAHTRIIPKRASWCRQNWVRDEIIKLGYDPNADGHIRRCVSLAALAPRSSSNFTQNSTLDVLDAPAFALPLSARSISLFARGTFGPSVLELVPSPNASQTALSADVRIVTHSHNPLHERTFICELSSHDHQDHALGIYGPSGTLDPNTQLSIFLTLRIPSSPTSYTQVANLTTSLPAFDHTLQDLGGVAHFTTLALSSHTGSIDIQVSPLLRTSASPLTQYSAVSHSRQHHPLHLRRLHLRSLPLHPLPPHRAHRAGQHRRRLRPARARRRRAFSFSLPLRVARQRHRRARPARRLHS